MRNVVAVVGSGYVGLTTAAILANCGYTVRTIDIDADKVDCIQAGKSHFYEPGLDQLVGQGIEQGLLTATTSFQAGLTDAFLVFSCVGTPDNPDGSPNLEYIYSAAREVASHVTDPVVYVQKSTVPVGTGDELIGVFKSEYPEADISYVSSPEFLREGSAIADTLGGDRIVVGGYDEKGVSAVADVYRAVDACREDVAARAGLEPPTAEYESRVVETTLKSAELVKVSANAFLALKISFANSIAKLADAAQADVGEVMDGVGLDKRIGRAFLNAGRGYGGGCFPKDVSGLIATAHEYGLDLPIMGAATEVNDSMPGYIVNRAKDVHGSLHDVSVAVLGLAFKAGTSDARKSPAVAIANALAHEEARVRAYDPHANGEASSDLNRKVALAESREEATNGADVIFVATDWPEFAELDYARLASNGTKLLVDCMNILHDGTVRQAGLEYMGVGCGTSVSPYS